MTNDETNPNGSKKATPRRWLIWIAVFGGIIILMLLRDRWEDQSDFISQYQFEQLLDAGDIAHATVVYSAQNSALTEIVGKYWKNQNDQKTAVPFRTKVRLTSRLEERLVRSPNFDLHEQNTMLFSVLWSILPIVVIAAFIWFFFIRQIKRVARNSPSTTDLSAKASDQLSRIDRILDRWEKQADRMDAVLDRVEEQTRGKKEATPGSDS